MNNNSTLKNHLFLWKLCVKASPKYMGFVIYDAIRYQLLVFVEHTLLIRYVLHCAEYNEPFYKAAIAVLIVFFSYVLAFGIDGYFKHNLELKEKPKLYKALKEMLYDKAATIDLECYDNPDYYNDLVLSVAESDNTINRFLELISLALKSIMIFLTTGVFYIFVDAAGLIFIFISFIVSILISKALNKINFDVRNKINPLEKKKNYVNRTFYLKDYAKEIRLHHEVGDILETDLYDANEEIVQIQKKVGKKRTLLAFTKDFCFSSLILDGLYVAYLIYKAVVLHTIDYSNAVVLFNRTGEMRRGMRDLSNVIPKANENNMYINKIREFIAYEPKIVSEKDLSVENNIGEIVLDNVSFSYSEDLSNTLNDISLRVKPGEKVAIVGYNGAGKTTLVKLLMRLYDPTNGSIKYDGRNIKEYDIDEYRKRIGVVFQDFQVYGASLLENVVMDVCDKSDKATSDLAKEALYHSGFGERFESFEKGLDTSITTEFDNKGINLSGGEGQKVAIARSFYKKANILIMDEPSSALDPIAEYSLNKAMDEMSIGKTVFYISHRLSTTRDADRIIMLEKGRIVEQGNHDELLKLDGKYAEMWKVQAGAYMSAS
ncbi:MAG: ABC transporter ATP-binding protein [Lachnospiraceae bacterium]|nr:ABC transporter ATP-binding protein [Lachnospiraceae bacterium]